MRPSLLPIGILVAACAAACAAGQSDDAASAEGALDGVSFSETTSTALRDQACGPGTDRGCYTNYAVVADLDGDGRFDLVLANGGDHFVAGRAEPQSVFFGDGGGHFLDGASAFKHGISPSIVRQVAIADFDGDGRLDVYFPGGYGRHDDQLFMQTASRTFVNQPARLAGGLRSRAGAVHAGDIDNDGDIDLVIADWGDHPNPDDSTPASAVKIRVLLNDGTGRFTAGPVLDAPGGSSATDIDLQDVDGDFSLDIVLTNRNGQSRLYTNDGRGNFADVTLAKGFPRKRGPFTFNAELCDVDGDGHLDLVFDGGARHLSGHATQLLMNDGSGRFTDETEARIASEPRSDDNQVKCVDVDNDGDMDLVVASLSNATEKLLRNDGTGHFQLVENVFPRLGDPTLSLDFADFDGDGRVDMFTAQGEVHGAPWLDRIFKNGTTAVDRIKPRFRGVERPRVMAGTATPIHVAVTDSHTSETGQHVKAVSFTIASGGSRSVVPAVFVGGDLFRAVIPAQPAGAVVEVTPRAVDHNGNEAVGAPLTLLTGAY